MYTHTQVRTQNERLRTELQESKTFVTTLREQIRKAEEKYKDLYQRYEKAKMLSTSGEEVETGLSGLQKKMFDIKAAFRSIDVIKLQFIEKV